MIYGLWKRQKETYVCYQLPNYISIEYLTSLLMPGSLAEKTFIIMVLTSGSTFQWFSFCFLKHSNSFSSLFSAFLLQKK